MCARERRERERERERLCITKMGKVSRREGGRDRRGGLFSGDEPNLRSNWETFSKDLCHIYTKPRPV